VLTALTSLNFDSLAKFTTLLTVSLLKLIAQEYSCSSEGANISFTPSFLLLSM